MKIHKEGTRLIIISLLVCIVVVGGILYLTPHMLFLHFFITTAAIAGIVFIIAFFRSPVRNFTPEGNAILCPADGKIVVIENIHDAEYLHDDRIQVSIFMSPFNVHVNWYPVQGEVAYFHHHPGRYLVAWHPKSSTDNERTTVVVKHPDNHAILIRQIAGAVARRIVCYASNHKNITQGEEMGFIKFGSRVDLLLPKDTQILVALHQKVKGKKTIIGYLPTKSSI